MSKYSQTVYNCQACNVSGADVEVTVEDCGTTIICHRCHEELGDDRSKAAFYRLPSDPREEAEEDVESVLVIIDTHTSKSGLDELALPWSWIPLSWRHTVCPIGSMVDSHYTVPRGIEVLSPGCYRSSLQDIGNLRDHVVALKTLVDEGFVDGKKAHLAFGTDGES